MEEAEKIFLELFGSIPEFVSIINCYNRNSISVYSLGNRKYIFKKFKEEELAKRENFFYEILSKRIHVPQVHYNEGCVLIADFIDSDKLQASNLINAIKDWAKIHSDYLGDKILENPIMLEHKSRNLEKFVLSNEEIFGKLTEELSNFLKDTSRERNYFSLIHGDLFGNNILVKNNFNYYIDFELSGFGHPARDLSLLLLNYPKMKLGIIDTYRKNINFDYYGIEKDINKEVVSKGVQLIVSLRKLNASLEVKKEIQNKFLRVIENYVL